MTINEIARRAGVSRATVSRYLNNGYVSQEKRERIARIIQETGYTPSQSAQQLRTGKTRLVGVIMPKINSQSVSRMVAGITDTLAHDNYQAVLVCTNNDEQAEIPFLQLFAKNHQVDGIILIATVFTPEHLSIIKSIRMPFVVLGQKSDLCSCVYHDDYAAAFEVTALMLPRARKVAYLGVKEEDRAAGEQRHQGFLDACAKHGLDVAPEAQLVVSFDADSGFFGAEKILNTMPDVDTIVCATDDIAFGAMMCMREYGRSVPDDVQVSGMGDSLLSQIVHPSLTTVHLSYKTSGTMAARMLMRQLHDADTPLETYCMPHQIYARNSMR